jgi:DNA transformation protein
MSASNEEKEFVTYLVEHMQPIGSVNAKRMFSGYGIFLDGLMFALVADNVLYLKADKETEDDFKARGLEAFSYQKKGKDYRMSYYQAPEEALEDVDEMSVWAGKAYGAALKAASKKRNK